MFYIKTSQGIGRHLTNTVEGQYTISRNWQHLFSESKVGVTQDQYTENPFVNYKYLKLKELTFLPFPLLWLMYPMWSSESWKGLGVIRDFLTWLLLLLLLVLTLNKHLKNEWTEKSYKERLRKRHLKKKVYLNLMHHKKYKIREDRSRKGRFLIY